MARSTKDSMFKLSKDSVIAIFRSKCQEFDKYWLYVELSNRPGAEPVTAHLNKDQTRNKDEWFTAKWYGSDRMDQGVVLIIAHYGSGNSQNCAVMTYGEFEGSQDLDYANLRTKLQTQRFNELAA